MAATVLDAPQAVREVSPEPTSTSPLAGGRERIPHTDFKPDTAGPILKGKDGDDLTLTDRAGKPTGTDNAGKPTVPDNGDQLSIKGMLEELQGLTAAVSPELGAKIIAGAIDATHEFMKDKGGFDYKPTGDADKDWAAISKVIDGLSPQDQEKLMTAILNATTTTLHADNEKYEHGRFGDNVRGNYLDEKQRKGEPLTEHERNELNGFEEFPDSDYLGYLAGRQLNHETLTQKQMEDLDTARRKREEKFDPPKAINDPLNK